MYDVETNASMWGNFRHRRGLTRRKTQNDDLIPWKLRDEHRFAYPALMLRLEARRREGKTIRAVDQGRLTNWLQRLDDDGVVVAYDPDDAEGVSYVPRDDQDTDIVRQPVSATGKRRAVE